MTYWKPLSVNFPRTDEEWEKEFTEYQKYPEYLLSKNKISLQKFKFIFFLEWFHRMLARSLGIVYLLPLLYFNYRGYLQKTMQKRLFGILGLFGL